MGMYNFQPRFVPQIERGIKHYTIRATRRFEEEPGDIMYLYVGLRTPACRLIARVPCIATARVFIPNRRVILINRRELTVDERHQLAVADGFSEWDEMAAFFQSRFPFRGKKYDWTPLTGRK